MGTMQNEIPLKHSMTCFLLHYLHSAGKKTNGLLGEQNILGIRDECFGLNFGGQVILLSIGIPGKDSQPVVTPIHRRQVSEAKCVPNATLAARPEVMRKFHRIHQSTNHHKHYVSVSICIVRFCILSVCLLQALSFFFLGLLVKPSCLIPRIKKWLEPIWRHLEKIVTFGRIDMFDFFGGSLPDPKTNHL